MELLSEISPGPGTTDLLLAGVAIRVEHGFNADFVRPDTTRPVVWRGYVFPNGMIDGDDYVNLSGEIVIDAGGPTATANLTFDGGAP